MSESEAIREAITLASREIVVSDAITELTNLLAENAQLRARNEELEKYHGFYMGKPVPEGDETLSEINCLRADLDEAIRVMENVVKVHPYFFEVGVWNAAYAFLSRMAHKE